MPLRRGPEELSCSQRGCEETAAWAITWSNPALPFGRDKHWLACDEHRPALESYLRYRGFPQQTAPLSVFLASDAGQTNTGQSRATGVELG